MGGVAIYGNIAQYGKNIGSGIARLITSLNSNSQIITTNTDPVFPEIRVSIIDHYGNLVRRRNQATTVVATVFSEFCMYEKQKCNEVVSTWNPQRPTCDNCPTRSQSLFGRPAREIPGLEGTVNFTGLGFRAWPGNHTLRLEIDRITPVFSQIIINDCKHGQQLLVEEGVPGAQCTACPSGYYKTIPGIAECKGCQAGFACPPTGDGIDSMIGSIKPIPCEAGTVTNRDLASFCQDCPLGQYQPQAIQNKCLDCDVGRFSNATKSLRCYDCSPGRSAESKNSIECLDCVPGRYSAIVRSPTCASCPKGYASSNSTTFGAAFSKCDPCQAGSFAESVGSTKCSECPKGKTASTSGMSVCGPCDEGTAAGSELSRICEICQPGLFALGIGNDRCTICPSGYANPLERGTECALCDAGEACPTGQATPIVCDAGWYTPRQGSAEWCVVFLFFCLHSSSILFSLSFNVMCS